MLNILWNYRKIILQSAKQDLVNRYAGSVLGTVWNVVQPLIQILIFTFVFSEIMPVRLPGVESRSAFSIYLCSGLLPWMAFSEGITRAANSLLENAHFLKKLPTPEVVFVAQGITGSTITGGVSLLLLLLVNLLLGGRLSPAWLSLPLVFALLMLFAFGLGLILSALTIFIRDTGQILGVFLQVWMWMTPIVYVKEILPPQYRVFLGFNPLYWFIEAFQQIIVQGRWPGAGHWGLIILTALLAIFAGTEVLVRLQAEIRDVI